MEVDEGAVRKPIALSLLVKPSSHGNGGADARVNQQSLVEPCSHGDGENAARMAVVESCSSGGRDANEPHPDAVKSLSNGRSGQTNGQEWA